MNDLLIFKNETLGEIRTITINGEPWFVGKDVAEVLGYERPAKAIMDHVDNEDKDAVPIQDIIGRMQNTQIINESGLIGLVMASKLPEAKKFQRWVISEVLPSIRKNGMYATEELLNNPLMAVQMFQRLYEEQQEKKRLQEQIINDRPYTNFAKAITATEDGVLLGAYAKVLSNDNITIGQNRLFEWFRNKGYLIKDGRQKNIPVQRYVEQGLFTVSESVIVTPNGDKNIFTTKITGKGQLYFIDKLREEFSRIRIQH